MQTKQISTKTIEALQRLKAKGIKLCIATGRSPVSLPKFVGVDFDAYLTFNGSYCYDQSGTIFSNPIYADDVQQIIRNAAALADPFPLPRRIGLPPMAPMRIWRNTIPSPI